MRVLIDTSYAARGPSGTAVYTERLAGALRERGEVEVVEARQPRRMRPGGGNPLRSALNAALDLDWLVRGLPRAASDAGADVVHHPLPAFSRRIAAAQVTTFHDVAFAELPAGYGWLWRAVTRRRYARAGRRSGAVVCVSEATAAEVRELLAVPPARVVVAPHGPGQALPPEALAAGSEHLLYVGDAERRKGVEGLLEAYRSYRAGSERPLPLVLAGGSARLAAGDGVRGEPAPGPLELARLLARAAALVHPSRHEGFGLTLAEAMAAGTPVVAVRNRGIEELCGGAALLVEPGELAAAMGRVERDPALRERLRSAGRERAQALSWAESARLHESAYTLALRTRGSGGPG